MKYVFLSLIFLALPSFAAEEKPAILQHVGLQDKLGTTPSLDLSFQNERGEEILLGSFFNKGKPVLLTLVYYECPNLCHYLLQGLTAGLKQMTWDVGKEFDLVTLSIAPNETPAIATKKKKELLVSYGRTISPESWPFLVGEEGAIQRLAGELGFEYEYDAESKQYAHPPVVYFLTPAGKLARALSGIQFAPRDLKLGLMEAAQGKIGNVVDKLLLFCYRYDPKANKYTLFASRLMMGGGVVTLIILGYLIIHLNKRGSKRS